MTHAECYETCFGDLQADGVNVKHLLALCNEGTKVAELGAGTARLARRVTDRDLILIESCPNMIEILRRKIAEAGVGHMVLPRPKFRIDLEDASLDGLYISANTLGEMRPLGFTLAEIARVLKPDGWFQFLNENPIDLRRRQPAYARAIPGMNGEFYRLGTTPASHHGEFSFDTILEYRGRESLSFATAQVLPDLSTTTRFLNMAGLEIIEAHGDFKRSIPLEPDSPAINLVCQKRKRTLDSHFPKLEAFYDGMATNYDRIIREGMYQVPEHVRELSASLSSRPLQVLDLGCGNGHMARKLTAHGYAWQFFGSDFSAEMLSEAAALGGYQSLLRADLNKGIPVIETGYFDFVLALGVLEFVADLNAFFKDLKRVLHRGGSAILSFERSSETSLPLGQVQENGVVKYHYEKNDLLERLARAGFIVDEYRDFTGYVSPTSKLSVPYHLVKVRPG